MKDVRKHPELLVAECTESQLRQYTDAAAAYRHYLDALKEAAEVRGSMYWRTSKGKRYLIRTSATGAQHSLGPDSTENRAIHERFVARKERAELTLRARKDKLEEMRKLNRVFQVGRTPTIVVDLLSALHGAGIAEQFLVVGTHAMYAYESACGVRVDGGALATRDLDLLFDTRQRLSFVTTMARRHESLIGVLRKADSSFRVLDEQKQTAVNADGFEVDIIRRQARDEDPHPLAMSDDEEHFWAVQVDSGNRLVSSRPFRQMVVDTRGRMALMHTIHPLDFAAVKERLGVSPSREAIKAPKDLLQASVARHLWDAYLRHTHGPALGAEQAADRGDASPASG